MCSGYDRYFQIARCFRDEDLRADRQPEFTQMDLEMSFVDVDDVIDVTERLLKHLWKEILGIDLKTPLPRMTWKEAMERFGSDKPESAVWHGASQCVGDSKKTAASACLPAPFRPEAL